jgi:two-component system, OmpR family, sensor histidine kinase MtrB
VARASEAARSMAEGLLATRLPVEKQDEFGAWAASFNDMAEALEDKITALSEAQERERRFTSDVAHELRTPLAALVGEASLLRDHLHRMPEEARRPAELLVADVARLRRLVEDLMEISRLDSGREELRREPVDLSLLIEATIRTRGWTDRVAVQTQAVALHTDRRRVERILSNLIGNAIDHGGGRAAVLAGFDASGPFVQVSDEGPGIPAEALPRLFDRFYKADRARTGPGSGLGLAIALENARLLGGSLDVASEPGRGARFIFRLPAGDVIPVIPTPRPENDVTQPLPRGEHRVSANAQDGLPKAQEGGQP